MNTKKLTIESASARYKADIELREAFVREVRDWCYVLLRTVLGDAFKATREMLPEFHLSRGVDGQAITSRLETRGDSQRPQGFISERANLGEVVRHVLTLLLAWNEGPQEIKNRAGEVKRVDYVKRGFKESIKRGGFGGKCSLVEFGEHAAAIEAFLVALVKVRGEYRVTEKAAAEESGADKVSFIAVKLNGDAWRTHPDSAMKLREAIASGAVTGITLEIDEKHITAWLERNKDIAAKAKARDEMKARNAKAAKARTPRNNKAAKAEAAAKALAAANGGSLPLTHVGTPQ